AFRDRLAGIDAEAHEYRFGVADISLSERPLECNRTLYRAGGGGEPGHEAVAHRFHLGAAVRVERLAGQALMLAQHLPRAFVAQPLVERGGAFDVGEYDGADGADVDFRRWDRCARRSRL